MRNRLHALCPYFAMFPEAFVERALLRHTVAGDWVFDPFSGRGTTVLQALLMGRQAAATDVNPVAYCVSAAKARLPELRSVLARVDELQQSHSRSSPRRVDEERRSLPPFFGRAFHYRTLNELLFLRGRLNWKTDDTDRFIAAILLGILHGEMGRSTRYLSNQMPRTISTKPDYSLRYWRSRGLWAPRRHVFSRVKQEAGLRLAGETPSMRGTVAMTDARHASRTLTSLRGKIAAFVTSPPYFNVTNYEEDQWLRLWLLGNAPRPTYRAISRDDRHERESDYWHFLTDAWLGLQTLARSDAVLICRIGGVGLQGPTVTAKLTESLLLAFPNASLVGKPRRSEIRKRQTPAFRPGSVGCRFEVDYTFALHPV
ncbi:MAG TPA: DNA methyltransferase [Dehalococcoidia bacterium]|nr:DNA methyltransferase [Dehalococcoidia bacterium]